MVFCPNKKKKHSTILFIINICFFCDCGLGASLACTGGAYDDIVRQCGRNRFEAMEHMDPLAIDFSGVVYSFAHLGTGGAHVALAVACCVC
eukprot:m.61282 g.61282  ORF g.61282 m.61282 type:complete len:91 (+) comp7989_c0_seq1:1993-2265(+)